MRVANRSGVGVEAEGNPQASRVNKTITIWASRFVLFLIEMKFLAVNDLRADAAALRTSSLAVLRTVYVKTPHTLLFGRDDADV
jgi:hypothetical protein